MTPARTVLALVALTVLTACGTAATSSPAPSSVTPAVANTVDPEAMRIWANEIKDPFTAWTDAINALGAEPAGTSPITMADDCQTIETAVIATQLVVAAPDPDLANELDAAESSSLNMAHACERWDFTTANTYQLETNRHIANLVVIMRRFTQ